MPFFLKTGKFKKEKFANFDEVQKEHKTPKCGGDHLVQGIFYYLCTKHHSTIYNGEGFAYEPKEIVFDFIEPNEKGIIYQHIIDIEDKAFHNNVQEFIRNCNIFHEQIGMFRFSDGCKEKDCYFCNLTKDTKLKLT